MIDDRGPRAIASPSGHTAMLTTGALTRPARIGTSGTLAIAIAVAALLHMGLILLLALALPAREGRIQGGVAPTLEVLIQTTTGQDSAASPMGSLAQEPELPAVLEARPAALTTNDMTQARPDERLPAASVGMPAAPEHTAPTLDATSALAPSSHASAPAAPEVIPWPPDPSQDTARPAAQDPDTPAITRLDDLLLSTPGAEPTQAPPRERQVDVASILDSRGAEIDRLANAARSPTAGTLERPRRETVSTSTPDLRYASYLGAWTRKVERIGSLNYPQAAREQRLYGSLILHVAVRADGSLEQVRILRSSGYDLLDEAAIRIVELAAPFAPFPPDIAAETDVLDIVRAWQFMKGGRLGWEH